MTQYKVLQSSTQLPSAEDLNELAEQGWTLVQIIESRGMYFVYMEKEEAHRRQR